MGAPAKPRFDVISIFPDQFPSLLAFGVVGRAFKAGLCELKVWNPRDFTDDPHRTVDDRPYGGGPGMVMLAEPLVRTLRAVRADRLNMGVDAEGQVAELMFLTPHGPLLKQGDIRALDQERPNGLILLCGRYEGVDQRFIDQYVSRTFCLGDFVLSGGELAVACLIDAWVRLLPGALNHALSADQDSFEQGLLDCPHYTRPEVFENISVPEVLLFGNHAKIAGWRSEKALAFTKRYRSDLLDRPQGKPRDERVQQELRGDKDVDHNE